MSTPYTIPQPGTSLSALAYSMAPSYGVDAGLISTALIMVNNNMSPDTLINPGQVINMPTVQEITTLMNTGTIPVATPRSSGINQSTILLLGAGLIGAYLIFTKG